jgi:GNAT superfamily N-acetyltransferase
VAVEVVDEIQKMGVGTALVARLVDRARAIGFTLLIATTLWENRPARADATARIPRPRELSCGRPYDA